MTALADALIGNRGLLEAGIGFEPVTRAARLVLFDQLDDEVARVEEQWHAADLSLQGLGLDPGVGQVDLERVPVENLHEGPHVSFLMSPPERFPNVSVMAYLVTPATSQLLDTADTGDVLLKVETMVKAGPVAADDSNLTGIETIVHRRIERTTEAVNNVIRRNTTMLGTTLPQQLPPRGGIGQQAWVRGQNKGTGPRYLWHGSVLQYTLQRISSFQ